MKLLFSLVARFVLLACMFITHAQTALAATPTWLAGCWESADKKSKEVWVAETDGSLTGFGVVLHNSQVVFYELLRIVSIDGEILTYTAHPEGQASATFTVDLVDENSVVFSNPNHDYPQVISYRHDGDKLFATISMLNGEKAQSFDKQHCE